MLKSDIYRPHQFQTQPRHHQQQIPFFSSSSTTPSHFSRNQSHIPYHLQHQNPFYASAEAAVPPAEPVPSLDVDLDEIDLDDIDLDIDAEGHGQSLSSSPTSTHSFMSQPAFAGLDGIPTIAIPRAARQLAPATTATGPQLLTTAALADASLLPPTEDMLHSGNMWLSSGSPMTPKSTSGRFPTHHRESSLSSLGSAGPASPFPHNTTNPLIAVSDSMYDGMAGLSAVDDFSSYQLAAPKPFPGTTTDSSFLTNYADLGMTAATAAYPPAQGGHTRTVKTEKGLLPPISVQARTSSAQSDASTLNNRSQSSVASSVASDSPATPTGDIEDDKTRLNVFNPCVPKLSRTMTDAYHDELYNPQFNLATTSPAQVPTSPSNPLFTQRLQAANSQHLSTNPSPLSVSTGRGQSPFRQDSPLAPTFANGVSPNANMRYGAVQNQRRALQEVDAMRQGMVQSTHAGTPQTISPKDAMLDFPEPENSTASYPLFPQQPVPAAASLSVAPQPTRVVLPDVGQSDFNSLLESSFNDLVNSRLQPSVQIPQQYPFVAHPQSQSITAHSSPTTATPRFGSTESRSSQTTHSSNTTSTSNGSRRPASTAADGGTYTCTYHGCTLRFETPSLLQRHKREGHRQAHGLNCRRIEPIGGPETLLNTQNGPHRCDRINPSTGKPCGTVFSRPYDLTRHEDTIHNARKQKVRCDLCTDEKTFSRADALTRHYRVCHPHFEFPGKHRRRGEHENDSSVHGNKHDA